MDDDYHPELAGYEPQEDKPLRSRRWTLLARGVVILTLVALIMPGIATSASFATATAERVCALWVDVEVTEQNRPLTQFELGGPGMLGWECYAVTALGKRHVVSMGIIPEPPVIVDGRVQPA